MTLPGPVKTVTGRTKGFSPLMVVFDRVCAANSEGPAEGGSPLSDDNSELEPPDPIPNSAVKRFSADGSVRFPHVRVGHRQALFRTPGSIEPGVFLCALEKRDREAS